MTLPNLYAGKLHAVLFRNWKTRVKGRDWYDFEWYVKRAVTVNLEHLQERMQESGDWDSKDTLTEEKLRGLLKERIDTLDIEKAKEDVQVFIKDRSVLDFWSRDYFKLLTDRMTF